MTPFIIETLAARHDRKSFDCGEESLNIFLKQYAKQNAEKGLGRTFVAVKENEPKIYGYYTISSSSFGFEIVPENLPRYPVPDSTESVPSFVHQSIIKARQLTFLPNKLTILWLDSIIWVDTVRPKF